MHESPWLSWERWGWEPTEGFQKWVGNRDNNTDSFSGATAIIRAFFSVIQNSSKVTFVALSIFHMDVLHHHLIKSLLLEIYGLLFFLRYDARSQMFAFAEKLYAARLKDNTGNINQFLTFCGVRSFLLLLRGQYSAPVIRNPQRLGLLVMIRVKCGKLCINELKQCVSHCAVYFSLFGTIYSHLCDCWCVQNLLGWYMPWNKFTSEKSEVHLRFFQWQPSFNSFPESLTKIFLFFFKDATDNTFHSILKKGTESLLPHIWDDSSLK